MRETGVEDGDVEILLTEDLDDVVGTGQRGQHGCAHTLAIRQRTVTSPLQLIATLRPKNDKNVKVGEKTIS